MDVLWPAGAMVMGAAAWQRAGAPAATRWPSVYPVGVAGVVVVAIETYDHFQRVDSGALLVATMTSTGVLVRLLMALRDNRRIMQRRAEEAVTDSLTGLRNRRGLFEDLDGAFAAGPGMPRRLIAIFDLNGFKLYNDTFGHSAGDDLLRRLGEAFTAAVGRDGTAYRLGGDEFCVMTRPGCPRPPEEVAVAAAAALAEHGTGFSVTAAHGTAWAPDEGDSPSEVLRLADARMYREKGLRPEAAMQQVRDVLLSALGAREPALVVGAGSIGELARAVGARAGLSGEDLDYTARAAELHDIGKVAVPDGILRKAGPLTAEEASFVRRHTLTGERILSAAPALRPVARIVRAALERWDGSGAPDGLRGDAIPLPARVVAVVSAYVG